MKIHSLTYNTIADIPEELKTEIKNGKFYSINRMKAYKVGSDIRLVSFTLLDRIVHVVLQVFGKDYLSDKVGSRFPNGPVVQISPDELFGAFQKVNEATTPLIDPSKNRPSSKISTPQLSESEQKDWEKIAQGLQGKKKGQVLKMYLPELPITKREELLDYHVQIGSFHSWTKTSTHLFIRQAEQDKLDSSQSTLLWRTLSLIVHELEGKDFIQSLASKGFGQDSMSQGFLREILLEKMPRRPENKAVTISCRQRPLVLSTVLNELLRQKKIHSWGFGRGTENAILRFQGSDQAPHEAISIEFKTLDRLLAEENFYRENKLVISDKHTSELSEAQKKDLCFVVDELNKRTQHGVKEFYGDRYKPVLELLKKHCYIHDFEEVGKPTLFRIYVKLEDVKNA